MGITLNLANAATSEAVPAWVPPGAKHYLAHTEEGHSIRALARNAGCHASTILRQIRKVETRRDDPLVDAALRKLVARTPAIPAKPASKTAPDASAAPPDDSTLLREALRVLRRLSETGAVLAVAEGLARAVVVRDVQGGATARTCVVEANVAEAMALMEWIIAQNRGRITRYKITGAGRQALEHLAETYDGPAELSRTSNGTGSETQKRVRYAAAESPLAVLARLRGKNGEPFLEEALVQAGERLREDFELAQLEGTLPQHWKQYLKGADTPLPSNLPQPIPKTAKQRVEAALRALGYDLSDVVLHCCCYLEGLESTEKRLGWSARSGKVVLRIALKHLKQYYDNDLGPGGAMIG